MKKSYACPACGGELKFQSMATVFAVCSYCRSMVTRTDVDVEKIGEMAVLPADMSPLQIGTSGVYNRKTFYLVGRLKQQWDGGTWNEWYACFDDGTSGWLAEAQGQWMMSFPLEPTPAVPDHTKLRIGDPVPAAKVVYTVRDRRIAHCAGAEGELPFPAPVGRKCISVDVSAEPDLFGTIDYGPEGVSFYTGKYLEFEEFKFQNLRQLDGW